MHDIELNSKVFLLLNIRYVGTPFPLAIIHANGGGVTMFQKCSYSSVFNK